MCTGRALPLVGWLFHNAVACNVRMYGTGLLRRRQQRQQQPQPQQVNAGKFRPGISTATQKWLAAESWTAPGKPG